MAGRKSAVSILTPAPSMPVTIMPRLVPPASLPKHLRAIWFETVAALPAEWFTPEHVPLLERYCFHVARARDLERLVAKVNPIRQLAKYQSLARAAAMETRMVVALARSMRLTHQARLHPVTAARLARAGGGRPGIEVLLDEE
jgi:hypothetical protein